MKFENAEKVHKILAHIESLEKSLIEISDHPDLLIRNNSGNIIYTIGTFPDAEHSYSNEARVLVKNVIADLKLRIEENKRQLSEL